MMVKQETNPQSTVISLYPMYHIIITVIIMISGLVLLFLDTLTRIECEDRVCRWWKEGVFINWQAHQIDRNDIYAFKVLSLTKSNGQSPLVELIMEQKNGIEITLAQSARISETKLAWQILNKWHTSNKKRSVSVNIGFSHSTTFMLSILLLFLAVIYALTFARIVVITISSKHRLTVIRKSTFKPPIQLTLNESTEFLVIKRGVLPQWSCLIVKSHHQPAVELTRDIWRFSYELEDIAQRLTHAIEQ